MRYKRVQWCSEKVNVPGIAWSKYESETAFQIYCADWLRKQYELTGNDSFRWWHHSANERANAREGFTAKMMGQSKGFPDFIHCGLRLAIEFKVFKGKVSNSQKEWHNHLKSVGWDVHVVYTFDKFRLLVLGRVASQSA